MRQHHRKDESQILRTRRLGIDQVMQEIDVASEAILVLLLLLNHFVNCESCFTVISLRTIRLFDRGHAPKSTP